ncbi:hypothetical protein BX600DRAFT_452022 [Xylariales sp. PMI_506]|nr:hypothetical protein BX600DRAFT_452022 [Xylariales sp. PMI_506]
MNPSVSMAQPKEVVTKFLQALAKRDFATMFTLVDLDGTWWVLGRPDKVPYGGTVSIKSRKEQLESYMGTMTTYDFVILDMVAEGSKVVVEGISKGSGPTEGALYENQVVMVITVDQDARIKSVREFLDPFEVFAYAEANAKQE